MKTKITTPLVEEVRRFYEAIIGLEVVEEWDEPGDRGVVLGFAGSGREALLEIYDGTAVDVGGLSLQFRVDDVDGFVATLPDNSTFEGPTRRPWGSRYVYLEDPIGIQVIVYDGGW